MRNFWAIVLFEPLAEDEFDVPGVLERGILERLVRWADDPKCKWVIEEAYCNLPGRFERDRVRLTPP